MHFGKRQKFKNRLHNKIYDIVLKAQEKAISKARSGMSGKEIDAIARAEIEKSGYGKYFVHSTGHGVGLDVHELPRISRLAEDRIEDDLVFSIEPGIYLPNAFGVRIGRFGCDEKWTRRDFVGGCQALDLVSRLERVNMKEQTPTLLHIAQSGDLSQG